MRLTSLEQKIVDIIAPAIKDFGIDLLWVEYKGGTLGVFAENAETGSLSIEECTKISREISPLLEVEDPIQTGYRLEVSSAGIDRPLFKLDDYVRYHDLEAKIEIDEAIEGQKKFRGVIREVKGDLIAFETDNGVVDLPFASIYKAKLVMSKELISETKKRIKKAEPQEDKEQKTAETTA